MNFLKYYFVNNFAKEITIYIGENSDLEDICGIFKLTEFSKIVFINNDNIYKLKEKLSIPKSKFVDFDELSNNRIKCLVLCGYINDEIINKLSLINVDELVGSFPKNFDTIKVWKKFRTQSSKIVLSRYCNELRNETLCWEKKQYKYELSIILPVYNVENYIEKCIQSLIKTDTNYFEFVFIDDGSTDKSTKIIEKYMKKDSRIKLIKKENGGCASARECGLKNSNGRYVGFVDPDDFVDQSMFDKLFERAIQGSYEICYCGYNEFYEDNSEIKNVDDLIGFPYENGTSDKELIDMLICFRRIAIWRGIYLKDFLNANNIHFHTELKRFDDLPFKVETLSRCKSIVSVPEFLYNYRLNRPGQDVSFSDERLFIHFQIFNILDNFFKIYRSSKQLDYYSIVKLDTHLWALSKIDKSLFTDYKSKAKIDLLKLKTKRELKEIAKSYCSKKQYKGLKKILK